MREVGLYDRRGDSCADRDRVQDHCLYAKGHTSRLYIEIGSMALQYDDRKSRIHSYSITACATEGALGQPIVRPSLEEGPSVVVRKARKTAAADSDNPES